MSLFFIIWILVALNLTVTIQHIIYVDPNNGKDQNLNHALGSVNQDNVKVQLSSGVFNLSTANTTLFNLSNFAIVGAGITETTIQCNSSGAGLFFLHMTNVTIANLAITNCSMLQNSTTWNDSAPVQYPSAATIHNSSIVTIHSVSFNHNNGIGLSLVNTGGLVNINGSMFDSNYVTEGNYPGGGGVYIEFPFCFPNNFPNSVLSDNHLSSNSHYIIHMCHFTNNIAKKIDPPRPLNEGLSCTRQTFGRGGGISVFFRGNSTNNTIDIINNDFVSNTAVWGGALFIEFDYITKENTVNMQHSQFSHNKCSYNKSQDISAGGAVQIVYAPYDSNASPSHNNVTFCNCNFSNNTAYWGGGVSYVIMTEKPQLGTGTNSLHFINCNWTYNVAKFGAAADLSLYQSMSAGVVLPVVFESCRFVSNTAVYNVKKDQFELQGSGTVYTNSIAIIFKGIIEFTANNESALVLSACHVSITDGCDISFTGNKGVKGGAIALLASSWMAIGKNTRVTFIKNGADEMGGAVYAEQTNEHNVISEWNCFFQYSDAKASPDEWNTTIEFQNNSSPNRGHSIYATTIQSCVWGKSYMHIDKDDVRNAFHWKPFLFTGKSTLTNKGEIGTDTTHYFIPRNGTQMTVSPGDRYRLKIDQTDDEGNNAEAIFYVRSDDPKVTRVDNRSLYIHSDIMQVYGKPRTSANIILRSLGSIPSTVTLNVTFGDCPPGFIYNNSEASRSVPCKCASEQEKNGIPGIVECNRNLYQAYIARFYWAGSITDNGTEIFVTSLCPSGFCNHSAQYKMLLPKKKSELDFCRDKNRKGVICGECMDGYTISGKYTCIKCHHGTGLGILYFILYECLPTLLFVFLILIFNLHITSGYWNSLIFYFQIVGTLNLYARQSPNDYWHKVYIEISQNIYGIWNLEFFQTIKPEICYIEGMKNVFELYLLKFCALIFPIGLIMLFYVFTNYLTTWFKKVDNFITKWKEWFSKDGHQTSLIHGLAAFLVVSYTRIALLSMNFLVSTPLYHSKRHPFFQNRAYFVGTMKYFSKEHAPYVVVAIILLLFSILLPVYLILPKLKHISVLLPDYLILPKLKCPWQEQQQQDPWTG